MAKKTLTRTDLTDAISSKTGLTRQQSTDIMEAALTTLSDGLKKEGHVKLSSFGSIIVRHKNTRVGRNPKTGKEVKITPRKSLSFKPSHILRERVSRAPS